MKVIRHILDALTELVHELMSKWKVLQVKVKIDGRHRGAPMGTWIPAGGTEIPWFYSMYVEKVYKSRI